MGKNHPEQQDDEVFLGNVHTDQWNQVGWRTKRTGEVAYLTDGSLSNSAGSRPHFAKVAEVQDQIAAFLIKGDSESAGHLQELVDTSSLQSRLEV